MGDYDPTTFWDKFDHLTKKTTPTYIKYALKLQNLDDPATLKNVNLNCVARLESFIASNTYKHQIPPNSDLQLYYGAFHLSSQNFKFSALDQEILNDLLRLVKENDLSFWSQSYSVPFKELNIYSELREKSDSTLLSILYRSFKDNINTKPTGRRYEEVLKLISAYFFTTFSPLFWENFSANMPVPKISVLKEYLSKESTKVVEGCLRVSQLKKFLQDRNLPMSVFLSEDTDCDTDSDTDCDGTKWTLG